MLCRLGPLAVPFVSDGLAAKVLAAQDRARLLDAEMFRAFASRYRLLRNVCSRLERVAWHAKQLQVMFPMLSAVDKRLDMIVGRAQFTLDEERTGTALAIEAVENTDLNSRRNRLIICRSNPLW
jgi:hypothetical protein